MIYNTFGNSALADAAKSWGFEKIETELGITIEPKKTYRPPVRQKSAATTRRGYYDNFIAHRVGGYDAAAAFDNRKKKELPAKMGAPSTMPDDWAQQWRRHSRRTDWRLWSGDAKPFPGWIKSLAISFNRQAGLPQKASLGFTLVYYMYVEGWSEEQAKNYAKPDKSTPRGMRYKGMIAAGVL